MKILPGTAKWQALKKQTAYFILQSYWIAALLFFSMLINGCVQYVPKPLVPTEEVKSIFSRVELKTKNEIAESDSNTWFPLATKIALEDGLSIEEANTLALYYSPEIVRARSATKIANAAVLSAGIFANPEFFIGPRFTEESKTILPAQLALELPLPGQFSSQKKMASSYAESKSWELAALELEILKKVRKKFIIYNAERQKIEQLKQLSEIAAAVLRWSEALYSSGSIDSLSFFLIKASVEEFNNTQEAKTSELIQMQSKLLETIGIISISEPITIAHANVNCSESIIIDDEAIFNNPQLKSAKALYEQAEASLRLEIIKQYPSFNFGPQFESSDDETSLGFGLGFSVPILNWNRGKIKQAEESRAAARNNYQSLLLSVMHKRERAKLQRAAVQKRITSYQSGYLTTASAINNSLAERLASGVTNIPEMLSAQSTITEAKIKAIDLQKDCEIATLNYAVLSGAAHTAEIFQPGKKD